MILTKEQAQLEEAKENSVPDVVPVYGDPNAGIAITINGQLSLLMLIERLHVGGVSVVSANTYGVK